MPDTVRAAHVGLRLSLLARAAHADRDLIARHPILRQLTAEVADLLDAVTLAATLTNPREREGAHLAAIARLKTELEGQEATP